MPFIYKRDLPGGSEHAAAGERQVDLPGRLPRFRGHPGGDLRTPVGLAPMARNCPRRNRLGCLRLVLPRAGTRVVVLGSSARGETPLDSGRSPESFAFPRLGDAQSVNSSRLLPVKTVSTKAWNRVASD